MVSFCNAILLITTTALNDYCDHNVCKDKLFKVDYLRVFITFFCLVILCCWGNYVIHVKEFNKNKKLPDAMRSEFRRRIMLTLEDGGDRDEERLGSESDTATAVPPHTYVTIGEEGGLRTVEMVKSTIHKNLPQNMYNSFKLIKSLSDSR